MPGEHFYDIPYILNSDMPSTALVVEEVYPDFDSGKTAVISAVVKDRELYLKWLKNTADTIDPSLINEGWLEPKKQNGGVSNFECLAADWNVSRESWTRHSIGQALIALNRGEPVELLELEGQAAPSWMNGGDTTRGYHGVIAGLPQGAVSVGGISAQRIRELSTLVPLERRYRDFPGPQSYGGLIVRTTTTVAQLTHLGLASGSYSKMRGGRPDALIVQAWRTQDSGSADRE